MKRASSNLLLLDVNVLLAVAWPNHQFHVAATERLGRGRERWATCALTQLGFMRLSSNPTVVGISKSPWEAALLLELLIRDSHHVYLDSLPSPATREFLEGFKRILGSKQVTDSYLLTLAERNRARLLTFDARLASFDRPEGTVELLGSAHS